MMVEAFAARQGIGLCRELGYQCLQLEGDCKVVVNAILSDSISQVKVEPIIADIQDQINYFQQCEVKFVGRESNSVAHSLARLAVKQTVPVVWVDTFSILVEVSVRKDCVFRKF
jgi:ribonuclease HI